MALKLTLCSNWRLPGLSDSSSVPWMIVRASHYLSNHLLKAQSGPLPIQICPYLSPISLPFAFKVKPTVPCVSYLMLPDPSSMSCQVTLEPSTAALLNGFKAFLPALHAPPTLENGTEEQKCHRLMIDVTTHPFTKCTELNVGDEAATHPEKGSALVK